MNILSELRSRFHNVLATLVDDPRPLLEMIRPSQDAKFGDYQANCAMPLGKQLGKSPRDVAAEIVEKLNLSDLCEPPEIAGPGFINLRLKDQWLVEQLNVARHDERLRIAPVKKPRTFVLDYSSPNVAKPMHVGHIRSTVIGDALCRTLRFLGHKVISDNHLGDWGTQFGMIIYGYKHFADAAAYEQHPVQELARLYKLVNQIAEYHGGKKKLPELQNQIKEREEDLAGQKELPPSGNKSEAKKAAKALRKLASQLDELQTELVALQGKLTTLENDAPLLALATEHTEIATAVLQETAKLHAGDAENLQLWEEFLPNCRNEIQRVYSRIKVKFDHEYGESFYHERLGEVVEDFQQKGLARESNGALCVFLDGFDAPMIIRKQDGAFLYATTDLATIQYRMKTWQPDAMLYVVDHRQGEHFEKLFAAAKLWGYENIELKHISFGTVMGEDGKPYKTRSGVAVGLEGLLDEAVLHAFRVVCENDDAKPNGAELDEAERKHIADVIGHAAIKYADLSHNRTSNYTFSYSKMMALHGNTATYMQYSYARVHGIFSKGDVDIEQLRNSQAEFNLQHPAERALGLELLRFGDALVDMTFDYRPNLLTGYLFELAKQYSVFFENCHVLRAENEDVRNSRLLLCDLTARTIKQGLTLLGIDVVSKM